MATNSLQNEVTGYTPQRPSSLYTPPNVGYPSSGQPSTPFSTPRPSQQPSSTYVPQGFRGSTSYSPRPSQPSYSNAGSSAFPPLISPESSSTYLPPQPPFFPSTSPRPPPSIGKPLSLGEDTEIEWWMQWHPIFFKDTLKNPWIPTALSSATWNQSKITKITIWLFFRTFKTFSTLRTTLNRRLP